MPNLTLSGTVPDLHTSTARGERNASRLSTAVGAFIEGFGFWLLMAVNENFERVHRVRSALSGRRNGLSNDWEGSVGGTPNGIFDLSRTRKNDGLKRWVNDSSNNRRNSWSMGRLSSKWSDKLNSCASSRWRNSITNDYLVQHLKESKKVYLTAWRADPRSTWRGLAGWSYEQCFHMSNICTQKLAALFALQGKLCLPIFHQRIIILHDRHEWLQIRENVLKIYIAIALFVFSQGLLHCGFSCPRHGRR